MASTKAYTSQCVALLMFALVMADDRISLQAHVLYHLIILEIFLFQPRRSEIMAGLRDLPANIQVGKHSDVTK